MGPGVTLAEVNVLLGADGRPLRRDLQTAQQQTERFARSVAQELHRVAVAAGHIGGSVERSARKSTRELDRIEKHARRLSAAFATLRTAEGLSRFGRDAQRVGRTLTMHLSRPLALLGVGIIKVATDFDSQMRRVRAITGATGSQFDALRNQAAELGRTTQFTAAQAADAMGFLAMAGFDANEILGAMPSTLQLAAAGSLDFATAADITTNILTGYGMTVDQLSHANDVLVKTFTSSNTNLQQLGEAFKYAGPVARSAGVEFEEAAAFIGMLGNAGIQASMAGTSLRGAITRLVAPTGKVADILQRLGIETVDANGNLVSLEKIIRQLETSGATTADIMTIFGLRAGPAMAAAVSQGSAELARFTQELRNSGGTAEEIAQAQMEGARGAFLRLKSAAEGLAIAIGDSGFLSDVADLAEGLARWATRAAESEPETLRLATTVGVLAAATGPAVWMLGSLIRAAGDVARGVAFTADTVRLAARRFTEWHDRVFLAVQRGESLASVLSLKLHPAALAVGAVVAAAIPIYQHWRREKERATRASEGLRRALEAQGVETRRITAETILNDLRTRGLADSYDRLGLSINDATLAVMGSDEHFEQLRQRIIGVAQAQDDSNANMQLAAQRADTMLAPLQELRDENRRQEEALRAEQVAALEAAGALDHLAMAAMGVRNAVADHMDSALATSIARNREGKHATDEHRQAIEELDPDVQQLAATYGLASDAADEFADETEQLTDEQRKLGEVVNEFADALGAYQTVLDDNTEAMREAAQKRADAHNEVIDAQIAELDSTDKTYREQRKILEDQKKTWEDFAYDVGVTVDEYIGKLEEQVRSYSEWEANLVTIAERAGTDVAMHLANLGPQAAPLVAEFVNASDEELARLKELLPEHARIAGEDVGVELEQKLFDAAAKGEAAAEAVQQATARGLRAKRDAVLGEHKATFDDLVSTAQDSWQRQLKVDAEMRDALIRQETEKENERRRRARARDVTLQGDVRDSWDKRRTTENQIRAATETDEQQWYVRRVSTTRSKQGELEQAVIDSWARRLATEGVSQRTAELLELDSWGRRLTTQTSKQAVQQQTTVDHAQLLNRHIRSGYNQIEATERSSFGTQQRIAREGAGGVVAHIAEKLGVGVGEVARIGAEYGRSLANAIEPLLGAIGDAKTRQAIRNYVSGQRITGLNAGGPVPGGTGAPNRDSILAGLTPGEFVQPQGTVAYYGTDVMEAVRRRRIPRSALRMLATFNDGGLAGFNQGGLVALGRWLIGQGARVSEHPAFGGVRGRHAPRSLHYIGDAIDVNYGPPGASPVERAFFDRVVPVIRSGVFGTFREILWRVAGHFDHLHVGGSGGSPSLGLFGLQLPEPPKFPYAGIWGSADATWKNTRDRMQRWVDSQFLMPAGTGPSTPEVEALKALAQEMLANRGWSHHWPAFNALVHGESGWNPAAKNPTSTAWGLGQFLVSTARAYGLPYGVATPAQQLDAMMRYIADVYGNPSNAYAKWLSRRPHWYNEGGPVAGVGLPVGSYDAGGWLPPGWSLAYNGLGRPERVEPHTPVSGAVSGLDMRPIEINVYAHTNDPHEHGRVAAMALRMAL